MKLLSAEQMQAVDKETISQGTPGVVLMQRAVLKLAGELMFYAQGRRPPVMVFAGPGNNGGDGFGLACILHRQGWSVDIRCCVPEERIKGDAAHFYASAKALGICVHDFSHAEAWQEMNATVAPGIWLVDALLGTGSQEAPRGAVGKAVEFLQRQHARHLIWSVDVPSGLNPNTGGPFDEQCCVKADHTLCLGGPKKGFTDEHALKWLGSVSVLDLDFAADLLEQKSEPGMEVLSDAEAASLLPGLHRHAHKGSRGHALLMGGSPGMTGAITLSAQAALRSGCGLVSVMCPYGCAPVVDTAIPEALVIFAKQGRFGGLSPQDIDYSAYDAVGIGPGLRTNLESRELLLRVFKENRLPMVLDADALNVLGQLENEEFSCSAECWLTPHPGEMARLQQMSVEEVLKDPQLTVLKCFERYKAHVLLKGARSLMRNMQGQEWLNLNGNLGMAKGGAGDVLTGLLTGLLAQGVARERVLPLAVYLHGRAGDLAAERKGISGMLAGDIVDAIPEVLRQLQGR